MNALKVVKIVLDINMNIMANALKIAQMDFYMTMKIIK